eukprot:4796216-Prymnesium_polylepis.1
MHTIRAPSQPRGASNAHHLCAPPSQPRGASNVHSPCAPIVLPRVKTFQNSPPWHPLALSRRQNEPRPSAPASPSAVKCERWMRMPTP